MSYWTLYIVHRNDSGLVELPTLLSLGENYKYKLHGEHKMPEFISILNHKKKLAKATLELKDNQITAAIEKLNEILKDRAEAREQGAQVEQEKQKFIEGLKKQMLEAGVSIEELSKTLGKGRSTAKAVTPAIYEIMDGEDIVQWNGKGRMPAAMKKAIDAGENLESLKIK